MLESLELKDTGPAPEMRFDFAPRLNVLAGDNGLGKSFVLDVAWWVLASTWPDAWPGTGASPNRENNSDPQIAASIRRSGAQRSFESSFDFQTGVWQRRSASSAPEPDEIVVYARVDGGVSVWDPARKAGKPRLPLGQIALGMSSSFQFTSREVWDGLRLRDDQTKVLCNGLISDWRTWQLEKNESFEALKRVLSTLSPLEPIVAEDRAVRVDDARDIPTIRLSYGSVPLIHASAGMKRILAFAYLLVWAWREHVEASKLRRTTPASTLVVLFDEVEAHLHPKWQRCILPALLAVAGALEPSLKVQILAVTHSPLVLASLEPQFDEATDALFVLDVDEANRVTARREPWVRRGTANAWLTSDVFELKQPYGSVQAERAIEEAKKALLDPNLSIDEIRRIHHELHAVLKETDPFWPRWLARAQAAGVAP